MMSLIVTTLWSLPPRVTLGEVSDYVKNMQSGSGVTWNGAELLQSGRELTTKWGNNLGLSSCAVPRSAVAYVVAYFRRTKLLPGVSERSGID